MRIAALGRTHWLYHSIEALVEHGHQIVVIGTAPAAAEYRVDADDFARLANQLGCPFFCDARIGGTNCLEALRVAGAEIGISVNWPTLIGENVLQLFPRGVVNAHAGDLPRFRGNGAPNWAILMGESQVTLTLHQMSTELDAGDVLLKRRFPLKLDTYVNDVYRFIEDNIPAMFVDVVHGIESGTLSAQPQSSDVLQSLRCLPRTQSDGLIDWNMSADQLSGLVRASSEPFAGAFTYLHGHRLIIWRARPEPLPAPHVGCPGQVVKITRERGEVSVLTGQDLFVLQEVETRRHGRSRAADLITSTRHRLGQVMEDEIDHLKHRVLELEASVRRMESSQVSVGAPASSEP